MVGMVPVVLFLNGFLRKGDCVGSVVRTVRGRGLGPKCWPMIVSANPAKGAVAMSRKKVIKASQCDPEFGAMNTCARTRPGPRRRIASGQHPLDVHGNVDERNLRHAFLNSYHQTGTAT